VPDGAFGGFFVIGGAHELTVAGNGVFSFQYHDHRRAGRHEVGQAAEKGALAMHGVKAFGLGLGHVDHFHGDDFQRIGLQPFDHFADYTLGHAVGFDD
jgi:hypothetical protein